MNETGDYSSTSRTEGGGYARSVGPCCSHGLVICNHVRPAARDHVRSPVRLMVSMLEQDAERKKRQEARQ